jgi:hypothetical protein
MTKDVLELAAGAIRQVVAARVRSDTEYDFMRMLL